MSEILIGRCGRTQEGQIRINKKSDFPLTLKLVKDGNFIKWYDCDFDIKAFVEDGFTTYTAGRSEGVFNHCRIEEDGTLTLFFDNHNLPIGELQIEVIFHHPDNDYGIDGVRQEAFTVASNILLVNDNGNALSLSIPEPKIVEKEVIKEVEKVVEVEVSRKENVNVFNVLGFDGFVESANNVEAETATANYTILFDKQNKRFVALHEGGYSANWHIENLDRTDEIYQTQGENVQPYANKIYIDKTDGVIYYWDGSNLSPLKVKPGDSAIDVSNLSTEIARIKERLTTIENRREETISVNANPNKVLNEINFESDAFKLGYFDNSGKSLIPHSSHSCIKINVEKYRGCEVKLDVEVIADRSGFINDKEQVTRLSIVENRAKIPNDAVYLFVTYAKDLETAKLSILQKLIIDEALKMKLNANEAEQRFISKELLKNKLRTNPENNLIGYMKSDNTLVNFVGFHGIRLDVRAFRGGKATINKPYMSGNLSTTGFVLENGEAQWVKDIIVNKKNVLKIPENAVTLWNTWRDEDARTEEQFIELEKIDEDLASKSYVEDVLKNKAEEIKNEINQRLGVQKLPQSMLWYVLGDSITAASVAKGEHYYELIAQRNNLREGENYISVASDGAKVTYSTGYGGSQLSKISTISPKATLVTILLGINDFQFNSPLGSCWRVEGKELIDIPTRIEDCTDFSKAVVYMVSNLIKRCPKATIAWVLPLRKRGVRKNSNGDYLEDYWKVILDVCEYFSCAVIKIAKESTLLNPNNENSGAFGDGVHPNKLGNLIMSYLIENQLALLVPNKQSVSSTTLSGKIVDSGGKAVDISLKFTSSAGVEIQTPAGYGGVFSVELEKGVNYNISSNGYTVNPSTIVIENDRDVKIIAVKN